MWDSPKHVGDGTVLPAYRTTADFYKCNRAELVADVVKRRVRACVLLSARYRRYS